MGYFASTEHLPSQRRARLCDTVSILEGMNLKAEADSQRRSLVFMLESTELASLGDRDAVAFSTREILSAAKQLRAQISSNREKIIIDDVIAALSLNTRRAN